MYCYDVRAHDIYLINALFFQAAKAKCNEDLTLWAPSIRNHFWHCSKTCDNDMKNLKARLCMLNKSFCG